MASDDSSCKGYIIEVSEEIKARTIRSKNQNVADIMVVQPTIIHGILHILVGRLFDWEFEAIDKAKHTKKLFMSFDNVTCEAIEYFAMRPFCQELDGSWPLNMSVSTVVNKESVVQGSEVQSRAQSSN